MRNPLHRPGRFDALPLLACVLAGFVATADDSSRADPAGTKRADRLAAAARQITVLLEERHISGERLDDMRAEVIFDRVFDRLDPQRLYFLADDLREFSSRRHTLDDEFRAGKLEFALEVHARLLKRIDSVSGIAAALLDRPFDLTRREFVDTRPGRFATGESELRTRWRKELKLRVLRSIVEHGTTEPEARAAVRGELLRHHALLETGRRDERVQVLFDAVTGAFDPHTVFMDPRAVEELDINLRLELVGIGVFLAVEKGRTLIRGIVGGGAAEAEGTLQAGDEIAAVGEGDKGPWIPIADLPLAETVPLIRGPIGSVVRLKIRRDGVDGPLQVSIRRARIVLNDRRAHGEILEVGSAPDAQRIGVVVLPSFYADRDGDPTRPSSTRDVRRELERFEDVDAVVLDLSRNHGGLLDEAVGVAGLFLPRGPIVQIANGRLPGVDEPTVDHRVLDDADPSVAWSGPLVVVTSRASASASEIVAGALADHGRALLVGDASTHGKGTVQTVVDVEIGSDGDEPVSHGALKLTTATFHLPSGAGTQQLGVMPHVIVPSRVAISGEASLDGALPYTEVAPAPGFLPAAPFASLPEIVELSLARRQQRAWFQKLAGDVLARPDAVEDRWIPLELEHFSAHHVQRRARLERESPAPGRTPKVVRDGYLEEILAIAADWARR